VADTCASGHLVGVTRARARIQGLRGVRLDGNRLGLDGFGGLADGTNTFERSPARPVIGRDYDVVSPRFTGETSVPTFDLPELLATKIRALFQRTKGRDLFDLLLAASGPAERAQDRRTPSVRRWPPIRAAGQEGAPNPEPYPHANGSAQ